jgi:PAS domain S-box-containing protein
MVPKMPDKIKTENLKILVANLKREIAELKRSNDLLTAEKKILDEILDNLPGTFYIWDDRPQLIRRNKRHDEITEYSADDYVNMVPTDFFDEDEHQKVTAAVEKTFAEGEVTVEATLVTKSGKKIPHVYTAVRTKMGDKPVLMGFAIDITERKKAEKQLRDALTEVEALRNQLEADCTYLGEEIKLMHDYGNIIGESEVFKYVLFSLEQIAPTDTTVLIHGESGTGKELIARALHSRSSRKERPLIKVDCAGLPANLIESELFGHEKGAFTGAVERRIGRFELADGATIFLDEIGELPLVLQQKLLRVLQDGEFERLGSSQVRNTDVRVIAATNRNLKNDVSKGRFRDDLWYRLNVFPLSIPPLRERAEDIPLLVNWTIQRLQRRLGKHIKTVPSSVMDDLKAYPWPGNVRELENVIERAVIVTPGNMLQLAAPLESPTSTSGNPPDAPVKTLSELEKDYILQVLRKTNWNISGKGGAAELLGLNSSTLRGRMRKHDIRRPSFKP